MKQRIILTVLLLAIICECGWLSTMKYQELQQVRGQYEQDSQKVAQRQQELDKLQEKLDSLGAEYRDAKNTDLADIQAQIDKVEAEKAELLAQIETMKTEIVGTEQNQKEEINDYSYYEGVYDALKKGLEKVKGYLSGD